MYALKRNSDNVIVETRNSKAYSGSQIPEGYTAVKQSNLKAGGTLISKKFTPCDDSVHLANDKAWKAARLDRIENGMNEDDKYKRCVRDNDPTSMDETCWIKLREAYPEE